MLVFILLRLAISFLKTEQIVANFTVFKLQMVLSLSQFLLSFALGVELYCYGRYYKVIQNLLLKMVNQLLRTDLTAAGSVIHHNCGHAETTVVNQISRATAHGY